MARAAIVNEKGEIEGSVPYGTISQISLIRGGPTNDTPTANWDQVEWLDKPATCPSGCIGDRCLLNRGNNCLMQVGTIPANLAPARP